MTMRIFKATNTLDGYLPPMDFTTDEALAEALLVGGKTVDLSAYPKLRGIFKTGVGTDNLPFAEAEKRGIAIALPSEATCAVIFEETACFACHLILTGLYAGSGVWESWHKVDRPQLASRRLLVVGAGRIGQRVIDKMNAFLHVDRFDIAHDAWDVLEPKIRHADCISLHVPLTPETDNLFDAVRLGWMKDGAVIVNTARGSIIDEEALYSELSSGRLRAAIDVFWKEPYKGRLGELPADRLIRSPHIASTCEDFLQGATLDFLKFINMLRKL